ncbi:D-3-phosphoglycerate dehydrogenase [Maioricimonas rarisocia]|uniref:D-3-phosphoglycerate dehydrogenase n=1 Tax=Maioricimonas rarisocia TaxID=2528026 RepID=A0A517ZEW0_9PLAN|nr:phosphoglycerate dehydrogenase [Maioricimonas rarisocia]QDU41017.1 D-3-phosphoglycerate dehydrogenase [Maioricimonas rarisocia]
MTLKIRCCALNSDQGPHFPTLQSAGFDVLPGNRDRNYWDESTLISELEECCAVIAGSEPYTRTVIEGCPELRVIARTGVGFDAIDLAACDERGIVVTTTPGVNHHSVAEHTIALLMGIARGFPDQDQRVRAGTWKRIERPRVMDTTIGVVGMGRIGKAVVTRARGLGMKVLGFEPYPDEEFCRRWEVELTDLDSLLSRSDYVSLHNPLTPESHKMMNAERFAKMKSGSVLINTARGGLVDEEALIAALKSGHLRAAGLDVFEVEPLPTDSPLVEMENVLLSGHVAGLDIESQRDTLTMAAETIIGLRDGHWPSHCIQNLKNVSDWSWTK